jgi:hypothetical protein
MLFGIKINFLGCSIFCKYPNSISKIVCFLIYFRKLELLTHHLMFFASQGSSMQADMF